MANEVRIKMTADDLASGKIKDVGSSAEKTAEKFRNMRGTFLAMGAAGAAITGVLALFTKSALEQQVGVNLLDNALRNVGTSYDAEKRAIEAVIGVLQDKTNIGDEDQRQSLATLIALTGDYQVSLQALEVIADMATAMQMDFSAASILVAKALAGQTSSLSRYGITIDSSATKTEVLAALTEKFGGAAEAAANPMTQLSNRTGDVSQALGDVLLPIIMSFLPKMEGLAKTSVEFMENNKGLTTAVVILAGALGALLIVGGAVGLLIPTMTFAYTGLAAAVTVATGAKLLFTAALWGNVAAWIALHAATGGLLLAVAAIVAAVVVGLVLLVKNWDTVYNTIKKGINFLIDGLNAWLNVHIYVVNKIIEGVNKLGSVFGKEIDEIATDVIPKLGFAIKHVDDNTQDYFEHTQTGWSKTTRVFKEMRKDYSDLAHTVEKSMEQVQSAHDKAVNEAIKQSKEADESNRRLWANKAERDDARRQADLNKEQEAADERVRIGKELFEQQKFIWESQKYQQDKDRAERKVKEDQELADDLERELERARFLSEQDTEAKKVFENMRAWAMAMPARFSSNLGRFSPVEAGGISSGTAIAMSVLKSQGARAGIDPSGQMYGRNQQGDRVQIVNVNVAGSLMGSDVQGEVEKAMSTAGQTGSMTDQEALTWIASQRNQ